MPIDKINKTIGRAQNAINAAETVGDLFGIDVAGALGLNGKLRRASAGFDVGRFSSVINKIGTQRNNMFLMNIPIPKTIRSQYSGAPSEVSPPYIPMLCAVASIPGMAFMTEQYQRYGYGPFDVTPYLPQFNESHLTFIVDADGVLLRFFQNWVNSIVNFDSFQGMNTKNDFGLCPYEVQYRDQYVVDAQLATYQSDSKKIHEFKFHNMYPVGINEIHMSWGSQNEVAMLDVRMAFTDYKSTLITPSYKKSDADDGLSLIQLIAKGASVVQAVGALRKPQSLGDVINVVNNAKTIARGFGL